MRKHPPARVVLPCIPPPWQSPHERASQAEGMFNFAEQGGEPRSGTKRVEEGLILEIQTRPTDTNMFNEKLTIFVGSRETAP